MKSKYELIKDGNMIILRDNKKNDTHYVTIEKDGKLSSRNSESLTVLSKYLKGLIIK